MFKSNYYADLPLDQWIAITPPEFVNAHLKLDPQLMKALRKQRVPVVPRSQPKQRLAQQRQQAFAFRRTVGRKGQQGQTHRHMDDAPATRLVQFAGSVLSRPALKDFAITTFGFRFGTHTRTNSRRSVVRIGKNCSRRKEQS